MGGQERQCVRGLWLVGLAVVLTLGASSFMLFGLSAIFYLPAAVAMAAAIALAVTDGGS